MAKSLKFIIEALLFASDKPLTVSDIRGCLPEATVGEIRGALKVLRYEYEAMGRSFSIKEVAGGYQLRTHSEYGSYILKMLQSSPNRLSRAAMETLSIIAYKQPILRQDIEKFRGVDVGGILRTLLEKGLVRIMGRKELPGRPLIYGTTKKFLEVFDLKDLKSLPKLKEIKDLGVDEFEPGTPEQLTLADMASQAVPAQDHARQDDPGATVAEEFAMTPAGDATPHQKTGEDAPGESETCEETKTTDKEGEPGDPEMISGYVPDENDPAEATSQEESGEELMTETNSEDVSHGQDAGEESSYNTGVYETEKTTPDQTQEKAPPADALFQAESPELDTSRGDSESEDF